jgi:hypothetical protein
MKVLRPRRFARWRANCRGLRSPDRAGGGVMILDWRPLAGGHPPVPFFVVAMLIFCWGCLCAVLIYHSIYVRPSNFLGVLGFIAISIIVPGFAVARVRGNREQLRMNARCIDYLWIDGFVQKRRRIPLRAIRRLSPFWVLIRSQTRRDLGPSRREYGLEIETLGRPLRVGQSPDPGQSYRLHEELERRLRDWLPAWADAADSPTCEILDASRTLPRPPSDSALSCRREWDRTEFFRCNPVELVDIQPYLVFSLIATALGVAILSSVFPAVGWPLVLSLAVSVGLLELIGWWAWAAQRRRWVVRPGEIQTSVPGPGLRWSRTTEIEWLDRIELRRVPSRGRMEPRQSPGFALALVDPDGADKAVFGPLTEGEARWMAGIVADVLKDALPRTGQQVYRWSVTVDEPTAGSQAMGDAWLDEILPGGGSNGRIPGKPVGPSPPECLRPAKSSESSDRRR